MNSCNINLNFNFCCDWKNINSFILIDTVNINNFDMFKTNAFDIIHTLI